MIMVPMAILQLSDTDDVYQVHRLTERWQDQCTYILIYQTPIDDGLERIWCQELFVGSVFPFLAETVQSRIILSEPIPVTLIVISAVVIDLDDTNHEDNVREWDRSVEGGFMGPDGWVDDNLDDDDVGHIGKID